MSEQKEPTDLQRDLSSLLNRYSAESVSGTPDFILAEFLIGVLKTYNEAVSKRAEWRGELVEFRPTTVPAFTNEQYDAGRKLGDNA
jgi:hypothetical protein